MIEPGATEITSASPRLEPAEIFHELLVHRWYLSERAGAEVSLTDTARDYIDTVLTKKPDELIAADTDVAGSGATTFTGPAHHGSFSVVQRFTRSP